MALNLAVLLNESTARRPNHTAIIAGDRSLTYAELNAAANKVANALRSLGIQRGDKVALMAPNVPQFPIIYYGILKLGATVVPINIAYKSGEVHYHLEDSDAVALFVWEEYADEAREGFVAVETCRHLIVINTPGSDRLPDGAISFNAMLAIGSSSFDTVWTMPDDTAVMLYTAGTTGHPKGAELTHFNIFYNAAILADRLLHIDESAVGLAALPLCYSFGQTCVMNTLLYAGGTISLLPHFDGEAALRAMARDNVTYFAGVPTMFLRLNQAAEATHSSAPSLRACICGGAPLSREALLRFQELFSVPLLEGYGLAETSPVATLNPMQAPRPGSVGLPIWGCDVRIIDSDGLAVPAGEAGEIVVRGHNVMKGYYKRPEANTEVMRGGWLHTGDVGRLDEAGFLYIVDRKKDVIIRGGSDVYPREVETVLYGHPAVAEAAVFGVSDPVLGEEVHAVLVLKPDARVSGDDIIAYCRERMAGFKYPRSIEFRSALPKDATGKVLKRTLRE